MFFHRIFTAAAVAAIALGIALVVPQQASAAPADAIKKLLTKVKLPPGFKISLYAVVPRARSMVVGKPMGTVFVGSRHGTIHLLQDRDRDGVAEVVIMKTDKLKVPNGVAFQDSELYFAEQNRIVKWAVPAEFDPDLPMIPPLFIPIMEGLPDEFLHGWRYLGFGPDRKLYVAIGSPCNICMPKGLEGSILRMDPDGKNMTVYAKGVRNSVGFDWHPKTGEMFFTDNGGDGMGDDVPSDELNNVTAPGQHFGFPYFAGGTDKSAEFGDKKPPQSTVAPVIKFQAHTANLGIHFYTGSMFPAEYKNDAFVAQHGSWNRSSPVGYQVMRIRFNDEGKPVGKEVFASGFLEGENAWGRPVDIKTLPDGSLLVSDDFVGAIYRITYQGS